MAQQRSELDSSAIMALTLRLAQQTENSCEPELIQEDGDHAEAEAS